MRLINRLFLALLSCALSVGVFAQTQDSTVVAAKDSVAPKKTKVFLEHANTLSFDKERNAEAQVLNGDVCFRHDSSYMYCDSAYFFEQTNSLEAFSNVRMEQGDTLFVYGNYLFYDGNTQIAYLRENVRMENGQVTLFTDSLNYERIPDIGYYFDGGLIVDSLNQLSSFYGQYSPSTKLAIFNDSVRLENEQFTLYSDTLHYNTDSKIATILGPSIIVSDSGTIYSSRGWYDTVNNTSLLLDRSQVVSGDRILTGDSIAYNRELGFGEAFGNTLKMTTVDSLYREVKAYYGVRFYRTDMQGVCDSMQFNTRDSILYMYTDPIVWNEQYQIYGDTILIFMNDSSIDFAHVKQFAFAIQQIDSTAFNQLKGNDLKAYFEGQVVNQIDVSGNAESIFFPLEKDGSMVGMNETKSGFLTIWLKDNKLDKLKIWPTPTGTMTPIPDLKPDQKYLKDFYWFDYIRPKDKDDIYQVVKRKAQDAPKRSNKFVH